MVIKFNINNQIITRTDNQQIVSDSKNYLVSEFSFSPEWTGINKTAQFTRIKAGKIYGVVYSVPVLNNKCNVPWEVLTDGGLVELSIFGGNLITTKPIIFNVITSGLKSGQLPEEPTPGYCDQLVEFLKYKFKGDKGDKGEKGEPGEKGDQGEPGEPGEVSLSDLTTALTAHDGSDLAHSDIRADIENLYSLINEQANDLFYWLGTEYIPFSPGVNYNPYPTGTIVNLSKESDHLFMKAERTIANATAINVGYSTDRKIDLSGYTKLFFDLDVELTGATAEALVGLDPNSRTDVNNYYSDLSIKLSTGNYGRQVHIIDVTAMNDSRYIKFFSGTSGIGTLSIVKCYRVWGE